MELATIIAGIFDGHPPFRITAYDGSVAGPVEAPVTVVLRRPEALRRIVTRPGELGLARAYVAGDLDVEGDLDALFSLEVPPPWALIKPEIFGALLRREGPELLRPLPPPSAEARPTGGLHSLSRDRQAISHHYDVSNAFYEQVLGPTMVYSCAVFEDGDPSLERAQLRKVDLVAAKLGLRPGMRLLDVGCGWGTMGLHAAATYGCEVVGVTLSAEQQAYATARAEQLGLADRCSFRFQDFREITDGPFDAISSIGMFEHVGRRSLEEYVVALRDLLRPGGRLLNHAIGRPATLEDRPAPSRLRSAVRQVAEAAGSNRSTRIQTEFMQRYVFPDGELHEVGNLCGHFQQMGFELRHLESLREHYALTLRCWLANLEAHAASARAAAGDERFRVWKLYMTGSAIGFERHHLEIHQALFVRPDHGRSQMALRPNFTASGEAEWFAPLLASAPHLTT